MIGQIQVGKAEVFIGDDNGEHSVEQLADMMLAKLIQVNGKAPPEIMEQVRAFREKAKLLFIRYLVQAQEIERRKLIRGNHTGHL